MKLYEITNKMRDLLHLLEIAEAEGNAESYEAIMLQIGSLHENKSTKLSDCCAYYHELAAEVDALNTEIERLDAAKAAAAKRLEGWKSYIAACVGVGEGWKSPLFKISWRKSSGVKILDENIIPATYMREKISYAPDKKQIAEDLKQGAVIPGAEIEERQNISIA